MVVGEPVERQKSPRDRGKGESRSGCHQRQLPRPTRRSILRPIFDNRVGNRSHESVDLLHAAEAVQIQGGEARGAVSAVGVFGGVKVRGQITIVVIDGEGIDAE